MERDFELKSARFIAADCMRRFLRPGDRAVDATMGNGHDTLALCRLVGEAGHVYAFDVQAQAVKNTRLRLREAGVEDRATLFHAGHEQMGSLVKPGVQAVMFNLGWLPGGDKAVTTRWATTQQAVQSALELLYPGGICVVCIYPGHPAGDEERQNLLNWLRTLRPQEYNVLAHRFLNAGSGAPECVIVQKQGGTAC